MQNRIAPDSPSASDLLDDLRNLVVETEKLISSTVTDGTGEAMAALHARYDAAQERLGVLYASAKDNVYAGAKYTDEAIHKHPYQSMAIVAGVCLLLGALLGRRRGA